jgi:hypothetical protein
MVGGFSRKEREVELPCRWLATSRLRLSLPKSLWVREFPLDGPHGCDSGHGRDSGHGSLKRA